MKTQIPKNGLVVETTLSEIESRRIVGVQHNLYVWRVKRRIIDQAFAACLNRMNNQGRAYGIVRASAKLGGEDLIWITRGREGGVSAVQMAPLVSVIGGFRFLGEIAPGVACTTCPAYEVPW